MLRQADKDGDQKVAPKELSALADTWFDKLDSDKAGKVGQEQFVARFADLLPSREGFGPPGGTARRGFGPAQFLAPGLFSAADLDKSGSLSRSEFKTAFAKWAVEWDTAKTGALTEENLRAGLNKAMPMQDFITRRGGGPGFRGPGGGGPGGAPAVDGVKLDPLFGVNDANKPLISKLLAVPSLRTRYLQYVQEIADKWLDWKKLGPIALEYFALIEPDVKIDTRKLDSTDRFLSALNAGGATRGGSMPLESFATERRGYLLSYPQIKELSQ
jgi:hypothetical protein